MYDAFQKTLQTLDTITGAQSAVINSDLEIVCGSLPRGVAREDLKRTESASWIHCKGQDVLRIRLRGHEKVLHLAVTFPDQVNKDKRPDFEDLYRLARLTECDTARLLDEFDTMRHMFQAVLDTIPVRVFWKDLNCVYKGVNRLFAEDAGYADRDQLIGKTDFDMVWADQAESYRSHDQYVMTTGHAKVDYEEPLTTPDGNQIWLQTSKIPLRNDHEEIFGVLGTYADITSRKESEAEREKLLAELANKNSELDRFTYTVSHDLKSPLVTIHCFLGLLGQKIRKACSSDIQKVLLDDVDRIHRASTKMTQLLEELQEMSRVGRILSPLQPVELRSLIEETALMCSGTLREAGADLRLQGQFPVVQVDEQRMTQVLLNLLDNACKYRSPDRPLIIEVIAGEDGSLAIKDNGIGISQAYHERVFGLFEKLDAQTEGNGIGLALVKRIVETHGGKVHIESTGQGTGTTFHLTLPLSPEDRDTSFDLVAENRPELRVDQA